MQTIRHLSVALSIGALAFAGSAFAKAKAPNCDVNGKQMHVKSQKACEKKSGKWMEANAASTLGSSTTTTPSAAPASTSPTTTAK